MNRIARKWAELKKSGAKALVPYITPEYPFKGLTLPLLRNLSGAGADMIEIGVPFSDPLADGTTIQRSSKTALLHGAGIVTILQSVEEFRGDSEVPVILMGYYNPLLQYGLSRFVDDASHAGVDGLIVADLPPEEAGDLKRESARAGLSNVFLIAPTTTRKRMGVIDAASTDFSYCVSVTGVTGARQGFGQNGSLSVFLRRVRTSTTKPFIVGFGISTHSQVLDVWRDADGAVVGSALINVLEKTKTYEEALDAAGVFLRSLRGSA